MQVKMITCAAGPDFNAQPGDVKHVSAEFGQALIEAGHAEPLAKAEAREDAQAEARQTATSPAARKRQRR